MFSTNSAGLANDECGFLPGVTSLDHEILRSVDREAAVWTFSLERLALRSFLLIDN
jgi:hypothetical protein